MRNATRPPSLFVQTGGEAPLRRLVDTFHDIVDTHPDGEALHRLHGQGTDMARLRLARFEFLCGFPGGPRHYARRTGHANLRKMHDHLAIGPAEVKSWLRCMVRAIEAAAFRWTWRPPDAALHARGRRAAQPRLTRAAAKKKGSRSCPEVRSAGALRTCDGA